MSAAAIRPASQVSTVIHSSLPPPPPAPPAGGPRNVACLEEFLERLAAHVGDHRRIGDAAQAAQFLEREKARAVADERAPVQVAHHGPFLLGEAGLLESGLR